MMNVMNELRSNSLPSGDWRDITHMYHNLKLQKGLLKNYYG